MRLHHQAARIKQTLEGNGIKILYHFTPISNLKWIAQYGCLLSKENLENKGIFPDIKTGGNELSLQLDRELGNWGKVHVYFCPHTPMAYGQQGQEHIVYVLINPEVAAWENVLFTDTNATRKRDRHRRGQGVEGINLVDFKTIRATLDDGPKPWDRTWHRNVQAEVLVPDEIPLDYIKSIAFISKASLGEGERLWGNWRCPPFEVDTDLFSKGFPCVEDALLTSQEVSKDNIETTEFINRREFIMERDSKVTLLVDLKTVPGLQARTLWTTSDGKAISEDSTKFEKGSGYWHWPSIKIERLSVGSYFVEYYLGDTKWIKIPFRVRR
jgi:hypothetical protein